MGWAHSFETWQGDSLVGGLYGVAIGRVFFGESMFTRVTDASKAALVHGFDLLRSRETKIIDCQVASAHTRSLGAIDIPRAEFLTMIAELCANPARPQTWRFP
jgi:leucyl/phenylalanyl-tRNA--protein transferase